MIGNRAAQGPTPSGPATAYKIVRVRKPDGSIVKVRRPCDPSDKDAISAPTPKAPAKLAETSVKPAVEVLPQELSKEPASTPVPAANQAKISSDKPTQPTTQPTPPPTKPTTNSTKGAPPGAKTATAISGIRLFRGFHRLHQHGSRALAAFDLTSTVGDYEDGDEDIDDADDDYDDNDDDDEEDDNSQYNNEHGTNNDNKTNGYSGSGTEGNCSAIHTGSATLPEYTTTRRTNPAANAAINEKGVKESKSEPKINEKDVLNGSVLNQFTSLHATCGSHHQYGRDSLSTLS